MILLTLSLLFNIFYKGNVNNFFRASNFDFPKIIKKEVEVVISHRIEIGVKKYKQILYTERRYPKEKIGKAHV